MYIYIHIYIDSYRHIYNPSHPRHMAWPFWPHQHIQRGHSMVCAAAHAEPACMCFMQLHGLR